MKFERILVLSDLSESSHAGLRLADSLAHRFHSRVTVANVHTAGALLSRIEAGNTTNEYRVAAWHRADSEKTLRTLAHHGIDPLRLESVEMADSDSARVGIAELIAKVKPDLVCMATHGRTGIKHVLLGSVAEHTIRTAGVPVILTRGERELGRDRPLRVMLALDLFNEPEPIVTQVASLLTPKDTLLLAHVVESAYLHLGAHAAEHMPDAPLLTRAAEERLSGVKVRTHGPALSVHVAAGKPGVVLIEMEKALEVDLIVAHTHGRSGFDHLMLGSVAEYLARRGISPVLVLPRIDRAVRE
ncbi:MAG: universal stress protein [Planctomycetota bacterium]